MSTETKDDFWKDAVIVDTYTRAQAIADGELADVTEIAKEYGFTFPVAMTSALFAIIETSAKQTQQTYDWIVWDCLTMLRYAIKSNPDTDRIEFEFSLMLDGKEKIMEVWSLIGPGDDAKPVITIMLRGED